MKHIVKHLICLLGAVFGNPSLYGEGVLVPLSQLSPFLEEHCFACHDDDVQKGDLNLDALPTDLSDRETFNRWVRVFDRIKDDEMPPPKKARPEVARIRTFLGTLHRPLTIADTKDRQERGRVSVRRLTRKEYQHTMHDLLGGDLPLVEQLPEDTVSHGFETVAAGQQLSHHHLARYLEAADLALAQVFTRLFDEEAPFRKEYPPSQLKQIRPGNNRSPEHRGDLSIAWKIGQQFYGRMNQTKVPKGGWYRVTLKGVRSINKDIVWGTLKSGACQSTEPMLFTLGLIEATKEPRDLVYEGWIRDGHCLEMRPADSQLKSAPSGATGGKVSYKGRDLEKQGYPGLGVTGIEIERVYPHASRAELWKRLVPGIPREEFDALYGKDDPKDVLKRVVEAFARRAFRRPISTEKLAPYVKLAEDRYAEADHRPDEALRVAYRAILCSPRFLTFYETSGILDDYAIASRMSYMLWNTMPDDALLQLAAAGRLRESAVRHKQVSRMLADARAQRFVESFTDQWLNLREINFTAPDERLFSRYDEAVHNSILAETRGFFYELLRKNAPVTQIVDSKYSMLNERLARHYQLPNVDVKLGKGLQWVRLNDPRRGGLITQASVLKVTANGTTTSPVVRGVWVNERILGTHIPPPPANVPAIEPDIRGAVSIRDQLEKHRSNESCMACHRIIDGPGFALENFDPTGQWRTKYGTKKNSAAVDSAGTTSDGAEFMDIKGWKAIYVKRPKALAKNLSEQLITYATGARPRFSDRETIKKIVEYQKSKGYGVATVLHTVIASPLFLNK